MKLLEKISQISDHLTVLTFDPDPCSLNCMIMQTLEREGVEVLRCDPDQESICEIFKISKCPTTLILKNKKESFRFDGNVGLLEILGKIK